MGKYLTRREAIKTGIGAAAYGSVGYLAGGVYGAAQKFYESLKDKIPYVKKELDKIDKDVEEGKYSKSAKKVKEIEDKRIDFLKKIFGKSNKKNIEQTVRDSSGQDKSGSKSLQGQDYSNSDEKISRRGFFESLLEIFYENPKTVGTGLGAGYGAGKGVLNSKGDPLKHYEQQAKKERLEIKNAIEAQNARISGLEKKLNSDESSPISTILLSLGFVAVLVSLFFSVPSFTGFFFNEEISFRNQTNSIISFSSFLIAMMFFYSSRKFKYS